MLNDVEYKYHYQAFGLDILSQFMIAGFIPAPVGETDVTIIKGEVSETLPDAINKGVLFEASANGFLLKVEDVARYYAHNGREIVVQPLGNAKYTEVSAFLNGTILGALLHQRGMLPLHASTVNYQGKGILVAGISGSGKSTLAAALVHDGATLVADDISVIDFTDTEVFVLPAFPSIKLWEDSLKHFNLKPDALQPVRSDIRKFYLHIDRFSKESVRIDHVFIIKSHNQFEYKVEILKGIDKFKVLKNHTYLFSGIPQTGLEQNHFRLASQLAVKIPISLLTRPNAEFNTNKLIDKIRDTINSNAHK